MLASRLLNDLSYFNISPKRNPTPTAELNLKVYKRNGQTWRHYGIINSIL